MASVPQVHLVDVDGCDVPLTERFEGPEPDAGDPAEWPAWTDDWYWEVDPDEVAELHALELERVEALADGPHPSVGEAIWAQMAEGSLPPIAGGAPDEPFEPSAEDLADYAVWSERLDALRGDPTFPAPATAADRARFQADLVEFYRLNPDA
jgi:hypothetical protein